MRYYNIVSRIYVRYHVVLREQIEQTGDLTDNDKLFAIYCCRPLMPQHLEYKTFRHDAEQAFSVDKENAIIKAVNNLFAAYGNKFSDAFIRDMLALVIKLMEINDVGKKENMDKRTEGVSQSLL